MASPPIENLCNINPSVDGPDFNRDEAQPGVVNNSLLQPRRPKMKRHSLNPRRVEQSTSYNFQFGETPEPNSMPRLEKGQIQSSVSCRRYIPTERDEVSLLFIPSYHTVVIFLNTLLVGILQVEYQSKTIPPFSEHPANMWIFVGSICSYCLGLAFKLKLRQNQQPSSMSCHMIDSTVLISAVVSPLSLALLFLHCSDTWLFSILSITSVMLFTHHRLVVMCRGVYEKMLNHFGAPPEASTAPSTTTARTRSEI